MFLRKLFHPIIILSFFSLFISCVDKPETPKDEFTEFWNSTLDELESFPFIATLVGSKIFDTEKVSLYKINSFNNIYFYVWFSEPILKGNYPAKIKYRGFGIGNTDINLFPHDSFMMEDNTLNLIVNIRGQGISIDQIPFENYLSNGNESKETYIYRGAFMDVVRSVNFIDRNPKSNGKILVQGGSQGGLLSIVATALTNKVNVCIANFPFLAQVSDYDKDGWAISAVKKDITYKQALDLLYFFDATNFAKKINVPYFSHTASDDIITPLFGVQTVFNNVNTPDKELFIVDCEGHGCSTLSTEAKQREMEFIDTYFAPNKS